MPSLPHLEPQLLSSLAVRKLNPPQLFPACPFHSSHVWCSCRDWGHTSIQYGDLMGWHQILKMQPPPYIAPPLCFPWIATQQLRNTKLQLEQLLQTTPSHNPQNPTSVLLSTLKVQNYYSRWHLLPINQHGYKHWAFFFFPSTSRTLHINQSWLYTNSALHIFFLLRTLFLLLLQSKKLLSAALTSSLTLSLTCSFLSSRHLSQCMWYKNFRNTF